jgi:hypothetical protein
MVKPLMMHCRASHTVDMACIVQNLPRELPSSGRKTAHRGVAARCRVESGKTRLQAAVASGKNTRAATTACQSPLLPQTTPKTILCSNTAINMISGFAGGAVGGAITGAAGGPGGILAGAILGAAAGAGVGWVASQLDDGESSAMVSGAVGGAMAPQSPGSMLGNAYGMAIGGGLAYDWQQGGVPSYIAGPAGGATGGAIGGGLAALSSWSLASVGKGAVVGGLAGGASAAVTALVAAGLHYLCN